jgi:hypothetical protein
MGYKNYILFLIPVLAGVFDLLENIGIICMLITKENISLSMVRLTSTSTMLKGCFLPLTLVILVFQLGTAGYKKLKSRNKSTV